MQFRWDAINEAIALTKATRYLEIGIESGHCMRKVSVQEKWGVDPAFDQHAFDAADVLWRMPSDVFFQEARGACNVVFVDGLHHAEQCYRDVLNALVIAKASVVILHDCCPTDQPMQAVPRSVGVWTGDVWKAIVRLKAEYPDTLHIRVFDTDFGIGIVVPKPDWSPRDLPPVIEGMAWTDLTWEFYVAHRNEWTYPPSSFSEWLRSALAR